MDINTQIKSQSNFQTFISLKSIYPEMNFNMEEDSNDQQQHPQFLQGKWSDDQNIKFAIFIDYHSKIFASKQRRKSQKIFKILSDYLNNRTPAQCRSHYQKIMIKFKTLAKIKKYYKQYFGEQLYYKEFKNFIQTYGNNKNQEQTNKQNHYTMNKQLIEIGVQTEEGIFNFQQYNKQIMILWQFQNFIMPYYSQNNGY